MTDYPLPPGDVMDLLREGLVIPAHPLALNRDRRLNERRQRALTRYYHAAGAGGIAVGVHTTQFAIRQPEHGLFKPVLELARETAAVCDAVSKRRTVLIAGVCGETPQACTEASFARETGYHAGLLSLAALPNADDDTLLRHCYAVAQEIPLIGFYLQPAVGGRVLPYSFWRRFLEIPNVVAVKVAPFNRYQTLDVVRAMAEAGRAHEIVLYTGNDDHIVLDLLARYAQPTTHGMVQVRFAGGLLGHWACWTRTAVKVFERCRALRDVESVPADLLVLAEQITDCNAAFFDVANGFAGSIAGIHEVLRRQGLLENTLCLDRREVLSPSQADEIERVCRAYPDLNDDAFVREHMDAWLS
ncbi:MAG: dihydrodipicolinate synthase family protein [Chloroflexi bacterium]|nr:dihydrodipicolinate synthase family protein [Chloroflexota bacterium]